MYGKEHYKIPIRDKNRGFFFKKTFSTKKYSKHIICSKYDASNK
jgi:hypothetical protein